MTVALRVILTVWEKTLECFLSKETKTIHILQTVQEQCSIYFGYALDRHFRRNLQEWQGIHFHY